MLIHLDSVEEFVRSVRGFVDCYVSTDTSELEEVLLQAGFHQTRFAGKGRKALIDEYQDHGAFYLCSGCAIDPKTGLEIDYMDIPLEEATRMRREIDFMPMSKFRVYTNGSQNVDRILLPIMSALAGERQNLGFINDNASAAFVKFSEFYR